MAEVNPYQAPQFTQKERPVSLQPDEGRYTVALWFVVIACVLCASYSLILEYLLSARSSGSVLLMLAGVCAIISAVVARRPWLAFSACVVGFWVGALVILPKYGVRYLQIPLALPLSLGAAVPAMLIGYVVRWRRSVKQTKLLVPAIQPDATNFENAFSERPGQ